MNILFIAEPYANLHQPIIDELHSQGHCVTFIEDSILPDIDWRQCWRGKRDKYFRKLKADFLGSYKRYWRGVIEGRDEIHQKFDILFVINGCSFHPYLMQFLRRKSPNLKSILYLWDNSEIYDYYYNAKYFDKVVTYDLADSIRYGVALLPFYYTHDMVYNPDIKYLISTIGNNHSRRLDICRDIHRIFCDKIKRDILPDHMQNNNSISLINLNIVDTNLPKDDIVCHRPFSIKEVVELIKNSYIILDTDRESQTGTTPRLIWALAMGKKIITTNKSISKFPFYNPKQILIIDRDDIVIPDDFILDREHINVTYDISTLRIDNWINFLLM